MEVAQLEVGARVGAVKRGNFTAGFIAEIKRGKVTTQADGATVYWRKTPGGRYDFIVEGADGIITAHRGWTKTAIRGVAENHGWEIRP
jgi:hypothetical protein